MPCRKHRQRRAQQRQQDAHRIHEGLDDLTDADVVARLDRADEAWLRELHERNHVQFYFDRGRPPDSDRELEDFILECELRAWLGMGAGWAFVLSTDRPTPLRRVMA